MTTPGARSPRERHWICAQRLRERRLALGLTQCEVVNRLPGNGERPTNRALSAMEHGRGLDLGLLPDFAMTLNCTVTYLLGLTDDPYSWQPDEWRSAVRPRPSPAVPDDVRPQVGVLGPNIPSGSARRRARGNPR